MMSFGDRRRIGLLLIDILLDLNSLFKPKNFGEMLSMVAGRE